MNNLPADVMADMNRGRVFAVDVAGDLAFQHVPGRRRLLSRWVRSMLGVPDEMPGIASLLLRAGTVSSDAQVAMARARASVVIRPPLAGIDLKDWKAHEAVVAIGYEHTRRLIEIGAVERATSDVGQEPISPTAL
jgi:NTE family protein